MNSLKKLVLLLILVLVMAPVIPSIAQDLPDLEGRTVTVAVENAYPPFNSINQDTGEAEGWDYDVVGELCVRLNCTPEYIEVGWDGMIIAVSNGEYDMAADGITITAERDEIVDFSTGYIGSEQRLLERIDEDRFTSLDEFGAGDYTVGVQTATTNYEAAVEFVGEDRIVAYDTFGFAVQALIAGDVDGVIIDDVAGQGYAGINADKVQLLDGSLKAEELGFIFPDSSDLVAAINAGLAAMEADGSLLAFHMKWGLVAAPAVELPDLEGRTITVAVENAYPPFNSINQDTGEAEGWDYDVVGELCVRLNCTPEYIEVGWDGMIIAVSNGEYDMAADGITITAERDEIVDFSTGYIGSEQRLLERIDEDRFTSLEEFGAGDYTVGVQTATTNYEAAVGFVGEDRIVAYDTFGFAVQALIAGDVDGVIIDDVAGQGYAGINADKVQLLDGSLKAEELGFIFPDGSDLVAAINAGLASMDADGSLLAYHMKWGLVAAPESE